MKYNATKVNSRLAINHGTLEQKPGLSAVDSLPYELINKVIAKSIHDIQSPLSCLQMFLDKALKYPELNNYHTNPDEFIARIIGIINNIPQSIKNNMPDYQAKNQHIIIVNQVIENITAEKRYEYTHLPITFEYNVSPKNNNLAIKCNLNAFERTLSNLLNNAVDACSGKSGVIKITLDMQEQLVYLTIEDNGNGMPNKIKNKILKNIAITYGKTNGQGLGFEQIHQTLTECSGKLQIIPNTLIQYTR